MGRKDIQIAVLTAAILVIAQSSFAVEEGIKYHALTSRVPFKFYGFVSAEAMWADSQLSSFGTNSNTAANGGVSPYVRTMVAFNRVVDESEETNNDALISFTLQNSRFGFLLEPYDFGGRPVSVDARLELDFWSTANLSAASVMPRIRRAYAGIGGERWRFLLGQEWDLFSPLNTGTLNVGNDLWRQGNLGFRRPQIRFTYDHPAGEGSDIEGSVSINLPSNAMNFDDSGNTTGIPMGEGRLGFLRELAAGRMRAYVSAAYARHKNDAAGAADVNNWALAASLDVPLHRYLMPSGEFQYGYSFGLLLSNSSDSARQRFIAGWGGIKSLWLEWFETNVGYGAEFVKSSQVAPGWVKSNQLAFGNVEFKPVRSFVIGIEYNYLRTSYQGSGASEANAVFTNILFYF